MLVYFGLSLSDVIIDSNPNIIMSVVEWSGVGSIRSCFPNDFKKNSKVVLGILRKISDLSPIKLLQSLHGSASFSFRI